MALYAPPPAFSSYRENPDGPGYYFDKADGSSYLGYGDEADRLRQQLDESAPPDMRTAYNEDAPFGSAESVPDVNAPIAAVDTPAAKVPTAADLSKAFASADTTAAALRGGPATQYPAGDPRNPATDLTPGRVGVTTVERPEGQPAPSAGPQGAATPDGELPPLPGMAEAGTAKPPLEIPTESRGRAGKMTFAPTERTVTAEGGLPEEAQGAAATAFKAQVEAKQMQALADKRVAEADYFSAENAKAQGVLQQQQIQDEIQAAEAKKAVLRGEFDKRMSIAQKEVDDQSKREVDPDRRLKKPGNKAMAIFAIMLGGIGQGLSQSARNAGLDAVNRSIDQDIDAQKDEIRQGNAKANNNLLRLKEQYGLDTEDAASTLKIAYLKQQQNALQIKAAEDGSRQAQAQLMQILPKYQEWEAAEQAKLQAHIYGKVTSTEKFRAQQTGGGSSLAEQVRQEKLRAEWVLAKNKQEHGGIAVKEDVAKPEGEVTPSLSRAAVAADNALSALYDLRKKSEAAGYTGLITDKVANLGGDSDYVAAVNHGTQSVASMEANGLAPDIKRVTELEHKLGSLNPKQRLAHIDSLIDIAKKKRNAIREVSAKTAKIGNIGAYQGSGEGGEE